MTFKVALGKLAKSSSLLIQRVENLYYISNSFFIFTVPKLEYEQSFTPGNPKFIGLNDGESVYWVDNVRKEGRNLYKIAAPLLTDNSSYDVIAHESPFLTDWRTNNKGLVRLFITDAQNLIYINNEFLEILKALTYHPYISFRARTQKGNVSPIVNTDLGIFILPINTNLPYTVDFRPTEEFTRETA